MNGASSAAASRSSSCEHAVMDTPSAPGRDGGGTERRESGSDPEPGAAGTEGRGGGGGALGRRPSCDGVRDGGGPPPVRDVGSEARVGGGTNARRAIR
jgi:hypothetical protein